LILHPWVVALCGGIVVLALFPARGRSATAREGRLIIHFVSLACFASAGWSLSRAGQTAAGILVLAAGFAWIGFIWIATVRMRLARATRADRREEEQEIAAEVGMSAAGVVGDSLEPQGRALLSRLQEMGRIKIGGISTPRDRIIHADCSGGVAEVVRIMRSSGFLRIPLTDGSLDRVVGITHAKDVAPLVLEGRSIPGLKQLMRRPLFVSLDWSVALLVELFRSQRSHMAIVVDEYGRTEGIVTRDDVFRHLSGGPGWEA